MEVGQTLETLMNRNGWSQHDVANKAGVSQATVSRVLSRQPQRNGPGYRRLCVFIQDTLGDSGDPQEALDAVKQIWDGSDEHAAALAHLIAASAELWPKLGGEGTNHR